MRLTGLSRSEASRYLSARGYPSSFYLIALGNVIFIMAPVSPGAVSVDSPNQGSRLVEYEDAKPVDSKHTDREE